MKRLIELDPKVKAIVSSGFSNDPIMAEFKDYGFRGVVKKPYQLEQLSRVLEEVLNRDPDGSRGKSGA